MTLTLHTITHSHKTHACKIGDSALYIYMVKGIVHSSGKSTMGERYKILISLGLLSLWNYTEQKI